MGGSTLTDYYCCYFGAARQGSVKRPAVQLKAWRRPEHVVATWQQPIDAIVEGSGYLGLGFRDGGLYKGCIGDNIDEYDRCYSGGDTRSLDYSSYRHGCLDGFLSALRDARSSFCSSGIEMRVL